MGRIKWKRRDALVTDPFFKVFLRKRLKREVTVEAIRDRFVTGREKEGFSFWQGLDEIDVMIGKDAKALHRLLPPEWKTSGGYIKGGLCVIPFFNGQEHMLGTVLDEREERAANETEDLCPRWEEILHQMEEEEDGGGGKEDETVGVGAMMGQKVITLAVDFGVGSPVPENLSSVSGLLGEIVGAGRRLKRVRQERTRWQKVVKHYMRKLEEVDSQANQAENNLMAFTQTFNSAVGILDEGQ